MNRFRTLIIIAVGLMLFTLGSCTKPYKITTELQRPLSRGLDISIGELTDELPIDFDPAKKPTTQDIDEFRSTLRIEILKILDKLPADADAVAGSYRVEGSILDYTKGSGFLRFMFGAWAGSAQVTTNLKMIDGSNGEIVFAGNFAGAVTSGWESGSEMWKRIAKNFADALKDETKRLTKGTK